MKKKVVKIVILMGAVMFFLLNSIAFAQEPPVADPQQGTVLPKTTKSMSECDIIMGFVDSNIYSTGKDNPKTVIAKRDKVPISGVDDDVTGNDILACGIMTGDIKLWMIPFYIRFILETVIALAGLISVGAMIYGGYMYLFTGFSGDQETGKNAIKNGIIGLVITLTAWAIVNIVIGLVTG
jgi:hypothetical protein